MVILVTGASHTGKTLLAQRLLEKYRYPCISIDLLKMGLIRSGYTDLTPEDDGKLTEYLWPILRETVKTAVENNQNLILEGVYIPLDWAKDFDAYYRQSIRCICLVMTERYIRAHFDDVRAYASVIENRGADEGLTLEGVLADNADFLARCRCKRRRAAADRPISTTYRRRCKKGRLYEYKKGLRRPAQAFFRLRRLSGLRFGGSGIHQRRLPAKNGWYFSSARRRS